MILRCLYIIELTDTEEGGLELVDPSWCPEEGPPRKKIKSPPVISPTASTTSLYSGGSSSIDWTTTGTTLDMQGTRVTRTQYGFRTLQESSAKMCLKVTGYPLPEITWYKDDLLLHEDERHTFYSDEDGFFALTIDPVQVEDTGRYTCMATNEYGQASTSAFFRVLKVEKESAPPTFVTTLKDQEVKEGEIASFECEVEGWPEPELVWLVDEQPLRPSHDFKLEYDGQNAKLEIRDAQPDDTGVYTVRIKNEYGSAESNAKLKVEPDPDKNHVAPEFQAVIEDVECDEGDTVKFKAVLTGDPNPEVIWLINGIPLSESDKVKFICEDGICILTIADVSRHFNGIVTCKATNRLGEQACDGNLKVRVPPAPPHFLRSLEDKISEEEQLIAFEVEVSGFPDPKLSFMIKGKQAESGKDFIEIIDKGDGLHRIEITRTSIDLHDGEIVCSAINEYGQAESRARIVVQAAQEQSRSAPSFLKEISDQTVKYGEKAVFEASVHGNPNPEISWYIDNLKLDNTMHGVLIETLSITDHKLTITGLSEYSGTVTCRAQNSIGRYETKAKLSVIVDEQKKHSPIFTEKLGDKSITEGSKGVFEVHVEAEPKADFKWFLGEQELTESEVIKIREFDGNSKLEISDLKLENTGIIRCVAKNSEGSSESLAKLTVNRKPHEPRFEKRPKNLAVQRGEEAQFEANASAEPEPQYQWFINGYQVTENMQGTKVEMVNNISVLTIDTEIFGSATISVTAINSMGKDESGARLTVEEEERKETEVQKETSVKSEKTEVSKVRSRNNEKSYSESVIKMTYKLNSKYVILCKKKLKSLQEVLNIATKTAVNPPVIKTTLESQNVKYGNKADFKISVEPSEVAVQWFSNGRPLSDGMPGVEISCQNFDFKLTVDSAQYAGIIAVRISNEAGTIEASANLHVIEEKIICKPPEFSCELSDISVKEKDRVEVTIESTGRATFQWNLNDKILQNGIENITIINEESKSILIFNQVTLQQAGKITVTAINEGGQASSSFNMKVEEGNIAPEIIEGPNSLSVKENETAVFRVEITGRPTPDVKWQLNGKELSTTDANIKIKSFENIYTLKIERVNVKHAGEVTVIAENVAGVVGKEVVLKVEPDLTTPVFKTHLIDRAVYEGEPLRWDIAIERPYKGVTVKWLLNDKELINSENIQIIDDGEGRYHLTIAEAKPEMTGTLMVQARNFYGISESHAFVEITEVYQKPELIKQPQDHIIEEEQTVKFSAIVKGKPVPKVTWYMDEKKLESSDELRVKYDESTGKTSIKIFRAKLSHSPQKVPKITVRAENIEGKTEASSTLTVRKKSEPPSITAEMKSRQVNEGTTVTFSVNVAGYPVPEVAWFLNGEPIFDGGDISITSENGEHTLKISNAIPEQSGEVSCEAKNSVGSRKQIATLVVKAVGEAPVFIKNIEDKLVVEGEELIMDAKLAQVKPAPKVTWLKDGAPLVDNHFKVSQESDGTLKLKIDSIKLSDKSRITLRAENQFGSADCSASIGVTKKRPMAKPAFLSDIPATTVTEGESLNVKLIITGDPTPFTKWYINNQLVVATEDTEMKEENGVYSLTIHGCTRDMTGIIKCVAYNKAGEVTTQGNLTIVTPIPVEFETSLCNAICREGDTLKLKAVLLGEPKPEVSWCALILYQKSQYVNDKKLEESQNIKIHAEKGTYTVTIKDITCDYSGKVLCEAVNEYGKATSEATLLVLPRGEPPDFIEWLSNIKARQGSQVTHKVVFTGDPKPTLTWYINNEVIEESEEITIHTDDSTSTLIIKSFNPDKHTGEIICKAENDAGEVSCTASMGPYTSDMFSESQTESEMMAEEVLTFEDGAEFATEAESIEEIQRTPTPIMAPKFIKKIKDTRAARGYQAIFECVVPDTKDGREIELIARIRVQTQIIEGYVTSELIIDDVVPEDAGKYVVIVENIAGHDFCEANLNVIEILVKPQTYAPEFVVAMQDKAIKEAEKVIFECKVVGEPQPRITWFHEKTPVVEETSKIVIESEGSVQRLVISSADIADQGLYRCVAENIEGKTEIKATLSVLAEAPQFTHHITSKEVNIGEKVILECSVKGLPQPVVQFFQESTRITSDSHHSIEHDTTNVHWRMVIEETEKSDFGTYHAVAINTAGMAESEAEIKQQKIKNKPEFLDVLKNRKVTEGDEIVMEVKFTGTPQPDVKWFKNNQEIEEEAEKILINTSDDTSILIIKNATAEESGSYRVDLVNSEGREASIADVTVEATAVAPRITKMLKDVKIHELETARMEITVTGVPTPDVQWFKDDAPVKIDNERIFIQEEESGQHTLTIKEARLEDAGVYSCKVVNKAGETESKARFAVEESIEAPKFSEGLRELSVPERETIELSVAVLGKPAPNVTWFKDGVSVNIDGKHIQERKDVTGHFTLIIKDAQKEDIGIYSCKAANTFGVAETEAEVTIESSLEVPQFIKGLQEISVNENAAAKLSVTVTGKPTPEILWFKDGVPLTIDNEHIVMKEHEHEQEHYTLILKNVRQEDSGTYTCKAINAAGTDETRGQIKFAKYEHDNVEEDVKPIFIEPLRVQTIKEGETVTVQCQINENSNADILWFLNDTAIQPSQHMIIEKLTDGKLSLTIRNATKSDVGTYRCEAVNKMGKACTASKIMFASETEEEVSDESAVIGFVQPLCDIAVAESSPVELTCALNITKDSTNIQVSWSKDGCEVASERALIEQLVDGTQKLKIEKVTAEDAGTYRCMATIADTSAWTEGKLVISEKAEEIPEGEGPPQFSTLLNSCVIPDNAKALLKCKVEGLPRAEIFWMKDGVELEQNDRIKSEFHEDGTILLEIESATKEDSGEYRCDAKNIYGTAWTTAPIQIVTSQELPKEGEAPDFIEPIKPVTVFAGDTAILEGKVIGEPKPEIAWYRGENELKEDMNMQMESCSDGTQRLVIKNATVDHTDEYRCLASNEYGDVWSVVTFTVKVPVTEEEAPIEQSAPTFLKTLKEISAKESEHVALECKIVGVPMPKIKWFKDKNEIKTDDIHFKRETLPDGTARLIIESVNKIDAGEFRCEAQNLFGTARTESMLHVLYAHETPIDSEISPEILQELRPVHANQGQQIAFECRISGIPIPEIRWFKDGKEIKPDDHIRIESLPDGTNRLTVDSVSVEDQGNYRCEATNNVGSMSSKAPLTVNVPETLILKKALEDTKVKVGSKIRLVVEVEGKPKTVKWYHGKDEIRSSKRNKLEKVTEQQYSLETDEAQSSDEGVYRVVLSTEAETIESSCTVTVLEEEVVPVFRKGLQDQTVPKGSKLVLEIEVEGSHKQVKWLKAGSPVNEKISRIKDLGSGKYQLVIDKVSENDQGEYTVQVSNSAGSAECKANICLKPDEQKPEIISGLKPEKCEIGDKVVLEVKVKGLIKQVKWYKNGVEAKNVETKQTDGNKYQLIIEKASKSDEAEYKIVLSNDAGETMSEAKLTVKLPKIKFIKGLENQVLDIGARAILSVEVNSPPRQVVVSNDEGSAESSCALTVKLPKLKITKSLEDQIVEKGQNVKLSVEVNTPPRQIKWFVQIDTKAKAKPKEINENVYRLEIPDVGKDDTAEYKVILSTDSDDTVESSCALTVKLPKLIITRDLEDQVAETGDNVKLYVEVNYKPKSVKWYKNGKEVRLTDSAKAVKIDDNTYQLEINETGKDDSAEYKVVFETDDDSVDSSCVLTVKLPKIVIIKGLKDKIVNAGETALLGVEVNVIPTSIKWYKNEEEITSGAKAKPKSVNDKSYQLEIPKTTEDDIANYKVILSTDDNEVDSSCMLTVKKPANKPTIEHGIEDQFIPVGKRLEIIIETTGKPKTVKWYKNGQELSEKKKMIEISKADDNHYLLKIEKCGLDDSGMYSVEVANEAGQAKSAGEITVEERITFLRPLKDLEVIEEEEAELLVETNIRPRSVKWYKNGQKLENIKAKLEIKSNDTKFRLFIEKAEKDDAGNYKVVLSNSAGDVDSSACLVVKKRKGQPKIIKGLEDQVIAKGDGLVLEIKADNEPTEVRWLKDGILLSKNIKATIEQVDEQTYRLTIPKTEITDAGRYTAEVINEVGRVQTTGNVEIDVKPEIVRGLSDSEINEDDEQVFKVETNVPVREIKWYKNGQEVKPTSKVILSNSAGVCDSSAELIVVQPNILKIIEGLRDVDVSEDQPIKLKVKVEGKPKTFKWLKNGQEITANDRIQMVDDIEAGEYTLLIPQSLTSDGAAYRILLTNEHGEVQSGSIAHVKPKKLEPTTSAATLLTPLEDMEVPEGDTLTLKCRISGEPTPTFKYKNDKEITPEARAVIRAALDGTITLRILDTTMEDAGRYSIIAMNSIGEVKSECKVRVLSADELPSEPKFVIPLQDVFVESGSRAEFSVKVRGSICGQDVQRFDNIVINNLADGNWTMTVENVTEIFVGEVKCIAENEHGRAQCVSELHIKDVKVGRLRGDEGYPPKFNVTLWDRRIPRGQLMTIECHVDAKPIADISWSKDGVSLMKSDRIEIHNSSDGACRVKIKDFNEEDVGTYKCTATNKFGVAETKSNLNIQAEIVEEEKKKREFAPRFNPPLTDKFANINETIRLSCKVDAIPKASVTWYKDGIPMRDNGRICIEYDSDQGHCLLTINHSTESDDGAYRCVAVNDLGSTNSACLVSISKLKEEVKDEGEEPFFTKGLVDKWLERGDKLTLKCVVTGSPKPEIKWYRNGILLRKSDKISIENSEDGVCMLVIEDCAMSDEGVYRCDAENSKGKTRTQSTVHVEKPFEKVEKKVMQGAAPRFINPLQDMTVYVGSVIDLECKVVGEPAPTVKSKDGMAIRDDSRHEWHTDATTGTYRLRIIDTNVHDEGVYRCVASNTAGSATTKSFVRISGTTYSYLSSSSEPPCFTISLSDARAVEGQLLKFECKIKGAPLTDLAWYKDGERINSNDRINIESDSNGRARLHIYPCSLSDEGLYRVIATNPSGSAHSKASAVVKKLPEEVNEDFMNGPVFDGYRAPRVVIPLESMKVMEGNEYVLKCKFSGDPRPSIKWFKNGERVYSYDRCTLHENDDGSSELIVKNATRFDSGGYRCVAENIYGTARTTCEVTIQIKEKKSQRNFEDEIRQSNAPGFSVPLTMKRAKQGETVILECVPYGKPFPDIKWLKDGIEIETLNKIKIESLDDKTQRLILQDVDFSVEGLYRCVATNEYGTVSTKAEVVFEGDRTLPTKKMKELFDTDVVESKPRIRRGLNNISVHQGSSIEMQVCTSGWPTPTVKWFKNNQEIKVIGPDDPLIVWTDDRGIHHCVILNASPEDEAEYALEASNKLGTARTEGAITIIKPREVPGITDHLAKGDLPYPPGFIRQLKNKHVFSHMPVVFDCLVIGNPSPEVNWYHNGKKLHPGGRIRIQSCRGGSHALIIMDAHTEDAGEYVAIARNSQGQASSSAVLDVTIPHLDSIKFDGSMDVTSYLTEEYGFKKTAYQSIPTPPDRGPFIKEVTGHYLTLSWIPTKRAPPRYPQVTYVVEIRELPEKDWILLDYNIPEPVCKVRNLELGKSYQFRVRAENIYGISDPSPASPPSRLMAPPQPVLDKDKRIIPLLDPYTERALDQAHAEQYACAPWFAPGVEERRFCAENDTLSITLCVSGYPDPKVVWKFRGMDLDISPTSKARVVTHGGSETTLTIIGFTKDNVGQYQCFALNKYGEAQQNIHVDLGARPRFTQPLANKVVPSGRPLRLDVRVEGSPYPDEWRPLVESSRVSFIREGPCLCSLIINDPLWRDSGIYSVMAVNDAGTATTSCSVTVEADEDLNENHEIHRRKTRVVLEARKVREIYEIDENDEKYEI
ncbi:unnamed protein product [Thelazia callipaeda]|uniref:Muscle M-line assembly protein unc-89 n=1 Tax=Thelazia callipaeda TaxID=103827 RepID=A0A158RC99_THECL|nr:unnamed protein product [Thelazia callipaeda]